MTLPGIEPAHCVPPLQPSPLGGWDLEIPLAELGRPIDFDALFGRRAPLAIEVGSGSGLFLSAEAARRPGVNFLAIEKERREVHRAKDKWRRRNLLNVRILHGDAHYLLEEFPAAASVDEYIVLFSDPWFKKRHHKRRFFQPRLLPILERTLRPGGRLYIKTDITGYYDVITELLAGAAFLENTLDRRLDLEPDPEDIMTNYQRKALEQGHPIHALEYRRKG